MIRQVTAGIIDKPRDYDQAVSIVREVLLSYKSLHKRAGHTFDYKTVDEVLEELQETCLILIIEEQYVFILREYSPLFSNDKILEEVLLSRYQAGSCTLKYVLGIMETIGKQLGCNILHLATLGQKGKALPRLYARCGFKEAYVTMKKEI